MSMVCLGTALKMAWDSSGGRPSFLNGDISVFQLQSSSLGVSSVSGLGSR